MSKKSLLMLAIFTPLLCAASQTSAPRAAPDVKKSTPTLEQWMSLKSAGGVQISPDGRFLAYSVRSANWEKDAFEDTLWVKRVDNGDSFQIPDEGGRNSTPRWSPDGKQLAFFSSRGKGTQIYVMRMSDRSVSPLTEVSGGIDEFAWAPDGTKLAFSTSEARGRDSNPPTEPDPAFSVAGDGPLYTSMLWILDLNSNAADVVNAPRRVVDGTDFAVDGFSWSPDSSRIAISGYEYTDPTPFWTYEIYVLTLSNSTVRQVVSSPGPDFFPIWSPDGRQIAYRTYALSPTDRYYTYSAGYVALVDVDGRNQRVVTRTFDEMTTPLAWFDNGIYFSGLARTYQHLYLVQPNTGAIKRISGPTESINSSYSFSRRGKQIAFIQEDAARYGEIYVSDISRPKPRRLTDFGEQLRPWRLGSREVIQWKAKDGTPVEGVLMKPADYNPAKKYPLMIIVHSGPVNVVDQPNISRDLPYPAEMFLNRGALVLRPNYRGSPGYGRKFRAAFGEKMGVGPRDDVLSGIDLLASRGMIDPTRIGVMGWSAGGYVASFAAMTTDRFRALSAGAAVSDLRVGYTLGHASSVKPDRATPWEDPQGHRAASPLTYVGQTKTPTLLQHGDSDTAVPIAGSIEMHRALMDLGVPVKFITYKKTGHVPSRLSVSRAIAQHNLEWFDRWIWNGSKGGEKLRQNLR